MPPRKDKISRRMYFIRTNSSYIIDVEVLLNEEEF